MGDTPLIGAGTYANAIAAVSCTGYGEFFIRAAAAHDVCSLMEYRGLSLGDACREVVQHKIKSIGGEGGLIAIDFNGNLCMEFNSAGMYRGAIKRGGETELAIYGDSSQLAW